MVFKGNLDIDPRGLIYEAYRMDIGPEESRSIFLDWALGTQLGADMRPKTNQHRLCANDILEVACNRD